MTDERGHFERGRWVPEIRFSADLTFEHARLPRIPVGHYEKGRFVGGCFERKGDRLVCTTPGAVSIRLPLKS